MMRRGAVLSQCSSSDVSGHRQLRLRALDPVCWSCAVQQEMSGAEIAWAHQFKAMIQAAGQHSHLEPVGALGAGAGSGHSFAQCSPGCFQLQHGKHVGCGKSCQDVKLPMQSCLCSYAAPFADATLGQTALREQCMALSHRDKMAAIPGTTP